MSQSLSTKPTHQSNKLAQQPTDSVFQAIVEAILEPSQPVEVETILEPSQPVEVETIPEPTQPTTFAHQPTEQADIFPAQVEAIF